jgi:threonine dehydrogenase-like Zn-dependent dehydrogenase
MGVNDLQVHTVPDPQVVSPHDAILKVRLGTTCGSDLHLLGGYLPTMREGDVIGHEYMGEVVETGPQTTLRVGERVVVPSFFGCGKCWYCRNELWSLCDNTHPKPELSEPLFGYPTGGICGYSHAFSGLAGSHAQFIRVPHADVNCFPVPEGVTDEQALFLSDAVPTAYTGVDLAGIQDGDVVAIWGCGGVGLMAARLAQLNGAARVICIDRLPERLAMARDRVGAETIDYATTDEGVTEQLRELTGGRGPDRVIEAVGMEGHGTGVQYAYDRVKQALRLETDRASALREAIHAVRKGGTVSVLGVYGLTDKFPMGLVINKGLTVRAAQQHGQRYMGRMFEHVLAGELDPTFLATHRMSLEEAPRGYELFKDKKDGCVRAVFAP